MTNPLVSLLGSTDLPDAVVMVTGAGSGIGAATARAVAVAGGAVGVVDRDRSRAEAIAGEIRAIGARAEAIECDVADDDAVALAVAQTATLGRITGLVTSAGIFHGPDLQPLESIDIADFRHVLDVNLGGTFSAIRHCLPHLYRGGGAIVTVASVAALRGNGMGAGYTASKGGVDALTRLVAVQGGPKNVRANCVCPGAVDTPMTGGYFGGDEAAARARKAVPLGRYANADDIARVVTWLLSDGAGYVTGQTLPVEGGSIVA
jgi:3-oxoacyl-[acyl-carrier protein] reductase